MKFLTTLLQMMCRITMVLNTKNGLQQRQGTSIDERADHVRRASTPPDCLDQRAGGALPTHSNNHNLN